MFTEPMLASPLPSGFTLSGDEWVAEEKFDGHRLIVEVGGSGGIADLFHEGRSVRAWSREGNPRILPSHVRDGLARLPEGVYDGELLAPGKRSFGVTELQNAGELVYTVFDLLELNGVDAKPHAYHYRRDRLDSIFAALEVGDEGPVRLAASTPVSSDAMVTALAQAVWARDGEGLILKRTSGAYHPRKRSKDWLKIKKLETAVLRVTGYRAGKMGPHSVVCLEDDNEVCTTVKVRNGAERARLEANPNSFIGRKLRIEFQEHTPDESYRHGRWDRWEDE